MNENATVNAGRVALPPASRQLRLCIVGGGGGGFIGPVHATAARLDNRYRLVAGALSSRPDVAARSGAEWFLPSDRIYADYREMARVEASRPDGAEVVAITTPNHTHYDIARTFLEAGIHVICDKPLTTTRADALDLQRRVTETGLGFYVTHAFAAYPIVREARAMVAAGKVGPINAVHVEFLGDWLTVPPGESPAEGWRTDPARSGPGGAIADIGTHAYHLACFVSGLDITAISADLRSTHAERQVDDTAHLLLRFKGGATGTLLASQVAPGNACGLRIRIFGAAGGLEWNQENPNYLFYSPLGKEVRRLGRGDIYLSADTQRMTRIPRGHPEGYLEAFANLYSEVGADLLARIDGEQRTPCLAADIADGVKGVAFIEAAIQSSVNDSQWVNL
ncbi:Gfo/Idh/MocA family protein [Rhizobium binxianense]